MLLIVLKKFNKTFKISKLYSVKVCFYQTLQYFYPKKTWIVETSLLDRLVLFLTIFVCHGQNLAKCEKSSV